MPPKKYLDFAESKPFKRIAKHLAQSSTDTREYVSITCPHCNVSFVQIPSECLASNKASECIRHLRMCEKAKAAGAQVAPRKRRAVAQTVAAESSTGNDVDSTELLAQLESEKTNSAAILASKADLADRNDVLRGRVQSLEDQMSQLNVEMQKMRAEMVQLKPLVPLLQQINGILGVTASVPPAADIHMYVSKVEHLKQAAALANSANANRVKALEKDVASLRVENTHLRDDLTDLRTKNAELHRTYKKYNDYWNLADELFDDPNTSVAFLRKAMTFTHPDKDPKYRKAANAWQKVLNFLVQEIRKH